MTVTISYVIRSLVGITLLLLWVTQSAYSSGSSDHWGYEGSGSPEHWGQLTPYILCKEGKNQSPVDINNISQVAGRKLQFFYQPSPLNIIDNGHTIQVNYTAGSHIIIDREKYKLLQFHFHTPSENTVLGEPYEMEAHLVHKDDQDNLAVIAIFMKEGAHNEFIDKIWMNVPKDKGKTHTHADVVIDAKRLIPHKRAYFSFNGSLTTPPCSEGVKWNVLRKPIEVSAKQIKAFRTLYKHNARPVMPINGRRIKSHAL